MDSDKDVQLKLSCVYNFINRAKRSVLECNFEVHRYARKKHEYF